MDNARAEYERHVRALAARAEQMREIGIDEESIARVLHAERQALSIRYKAQTPEPLRSLLVRWTVARYGNPEGPSIGQLRTAGRSWTEIAASASRPGQLPHESELP